MTVLVMPQPADGETDLKLNPADVKVETTKASGAGGQHANTTESAIRLTHLPTGITVVMQDERSQHRNKDKAFKVLRARLFERKRMEEEAQRQSERAQIRGHGDRSERIRTYNFPTDRISDHRISMTRHGLDNMLQGGDLFDDFNRSLRDSEKEERLVALLREVDGN
jgi:peptide chain release factor 1